MLLLLLACGPGDDTGGPVDADGDGATSAVDCNDADATVHPGAEERCDDVDEDCDGEVDDGATDAGTWYLDGDADGWGAGTAFEACDPPAGASAVDGDCDDTTPAVAPDAIEHCDGRDEDCDGTADEDAVDPADWYTDADRDGYGAGGPVSACEPPPGTSGVDGDCDDTDPGVSPDADEHCDGVDEDCDGETDEDALDAPDWYTDGDADGYGAGGAVQACDAPVGTSAIEGDCDDTNGEVFPTATERCNDLDDDCDGSTDEGDAADVRAWYADADADGAGDHDVYAIACDAPVGFVASSDDCDDADASVYPDAPETCDDVDDDCDGDIDEEAEDAPTWYGDDDGDGAGEDTDTVVTCDAPLGYVATGGDCDDTDDRRSPLADELCNGRDEDCDGTADDAAIDATPWYDDADLDGYGSTETVACEAPAGTVALGGDCDDTSAAVNPGTLEVCDGIDQDCDGTADEESTDAPAWYVDGDGDGYGDRETPTIDCVAPAGTIATGGDCDDVDPAVSPAAVEVCDDGIDNNCDDSAGTCALSGTVAAADADAVVAYTGENAYFGTAVFAGDVTGDGADELFVTAGNLGNGALLGYGAPTGSLTQADAWLLLEAGTSTSALGWSGAAFDLTGDGNDDLLVGAPYDSTTGYSRGAAYVFEGPLSGAENLATAAFAVTGAADSASIGGRVREGDFNGDGAPDLLAGAWYGEQAEIHLGPLTGSGAAPWATFEDTAACMAGAVGDFDGDGVDDLACGFGDFSGTAKSVYVTFAPTAGTYDLSADADASLRETGSTAYVGQDVMADADLDGDGRDDLVVGAPWSGSPTRSGVAYVLTTVPTSGTNYLESSAASTLNGTATYQYLGQSLAHADLDGDGREDLVAGAPGASGSTPSVAVFYSLADDTPELAVTGTAGALGDYVATGDFDGDGDPDLAVTDWGVDDGDAWAAGAAYVWYGSGL